MQLRCLGIAENDRAGAGALLIGSNDQPLLELSPQLEGIHTACTAELQVVLEGLKAVRALGFQRPRLALSPFVLLKLSGSVAPLDATELSTLVAVQGLIAELGANVKGVPIDRNRRALRLARTSIAKYVNAPPAVPNPVVLPDETRGGQEPCPICLESHPPAAMFALAHCRHSFCKACAAQHATVRVRARALPVPCPDPGCGSEFSRLRDRPSARRVRTAAGRPSRELHPGGGARVLSVQGLQRDDVSGGLGGCGRAELVFAPAPDGRWAGGLRQLPPAVLPGVPGSVASADDLPTVSGEGERGCGPPPAVIVLLLRSFLPFSGFRGSEDCSFSISLHFSTRMVLLLDEIEVPLHLLIRRQALCTEQNTFPDLSTYDLNAEV